MDAKQCIGCREGSREALVSWNDGETVYTGRINDNHAGGGFAMPAFTASESRKIAADTWGVAGLCTIKEQEDGSFIIHDCTTSFVVNGEPDNTRHETCGRGDDTRVEAEPCCGLYFIGDWWVWGEVELGDLPQFTSAHLTSL
jgi:hypothetical protein